MANLASNMIGVGMVKEFQQRNKWGADSVLLSFYSTIKGYVYYMSGVALGF